MDIELSQLIFFKRLPFTIELLLCFLISVGYEPIFELYSELLIYMVIFVYASTILS